MKEVRLCSESTNNYCIYLFQDDEAPLTPRVRVEPIYRRSYSANTEVKSPVKYFKNSPSGAVISTRVIYKVGIVLPTVLNCNLYFITIKFGV